MPWTTYAIVMGVVILLSFGISFYFIRRTKQEYGTFQALKAENEIRAERLSRQDTEISEKNKQIKELIGAVERAEERKAHAVELSEKELELEGARRRAAFEEQLNNEFEEMRKDSKASQYGRLLQNLEDQIAEAKATLAAHQSSIKEQANKEDFKKEHSIGLTSADLADISLIRDFAPRLTRRDAFTKLIWTEFYQKPLQALCKSLAADHTVGIYKITGPDERVYIGQAVDIGTRWKEHVKSGLGIGTSAYQTSKFYKAMHQLGPENFTFEILEKVPQDKLNERERYWIDFYNATSFGYNTKIGG